MARGALGHHLQRRTACTTAISEGCVIICKLCSQLSVSIYVMYEAWGNKGIEVDHTSYRGAVQCCLQSGELVHDPLSSTMCFVSFFSNETGIISSIFTSWWRIFNLVIFGHKSNLSFVHSVFLCVGDHIGLLLGPVSMVVILGSIMIVPSMRSYWCCG